MGNDYTYYHLFPNSHSNEKYSAKERREQEKTLDLDTPPKVRNNAILVQVEGRVQRVGFRRFVESVAWDLDLTGYVENLKDGSVRIFVQGPESSIEQFKTRIEKAPEPIVVRKFEAKKTRPNPSIRNFRIKTGALATEIQEGFGGMEAQFSDYRGEFREFTKRTDENFISLNSNFNDYRGEFRNFAGRTDENFKTLGDKYGEISSKLTNVLETLERESAETRRELTRAVDKLSNLIDQYIKSQQDNRSNS